MVETMIGAATAALQAAACLAAVVAGFGGVGMLAARIADGRMECNRYGVGGERCCADCADHG